MQINLFVLSLDIMCTDATALETEHTRNFTIKTHLKISYVETKQHPMQALTWSIQIQTNSIERSFVLCLRSVYLSVHS